MDFKRQLTPYEWLQMPRELRILFRETFNIPRSGGTIVTGNKIESDGYTVEDLSRVSLKTLQDYLGTENDHWDQLLQLIINKMKNGDDKELDPNTASGIIAKTIGTDQGTISPKRHYKKTEKAV